MGTLIFHILLFSTFLIAELDIRNEIKEEPIIIDFAMLEELEEIMEQMEKTQDQNEASNMSEDNPYTAASNQAVNDAPMKDEFFDNDYLKELEAAQKMVSDVNDQLSKEIANIEDFDMPEITSEGEHPDSIKNTIYSGESNIHYFLENRYHLRMANPVYLAKGGGKITVDIEVNRKGRVVNAVPRLNNSINDPMLPEYAKSAALRTMFNEDNSAPKNQAGTITYTFVPQ